MKKIIVYLSKKVNKEYSDYLIENIKNKDFHFEFQNENEIFDDLNNLVKKIQNKEIQRVITIDDFGSLPFMIMAKHKNIVVAQVSDFHSAKMTIQHNNSNVLALPSYILAKENMVHIIDAYLNANFDAGRHMVRINMLEVILEEEK